MIGRLLPLFVLLVLAGDARAKDALDPKDVARLKAEMALRARVPAAVERAVAWLSKQQRQDGSFLMQELESAPSRVTTWRYGKTALAALTLVHAGVEPRDARLLRALGYLRRNWRKFKKPGPPTSGATYSLSLLAVVLHAYHKRHGTPPEGAEVRTNPLGLPKQDLTIVRFVAKWLLDTRVKDSLFSYPLPSPKVPAKLGRKRRPAIRDAPKVYDMSNTQYALLGLWACARCGVRFPIEDLHSIADALLRVQARSGPAVRRRLDPSPGAASGAHVYAGLTDRARGFGYRAAPKIKHLAQFLTGSLTAGGLSSLLVVKAILREQHELERRLERRLDRGIWDAIAWLDQCYSVRKNPSSIELGRLPVEQARLLEGKAPDLGGMWHTYYLYGLERAMVIAGKRYIGTHDWYLDGARVLLDSQNVDGHWPKLAGPAGAAAATLPGRYPLPSTCFGVLFLQRATLRPRAPLIETRKSSER